MMILRTNETAVQTRCAYIAEHGTTPVGTPSSGDLAEYQRTISLAYEQAPTVDANIVDAYQALASECLTQFDALLASGMRVMFHDDDPTPTINGRPSFKRLIEDVQATSTLHVYRSQGDHAILDAMTTAHEGRVETLNSIFRAVHDFFGHLASGGHFGWEGETAAYYSHAAMFSMDARQALFSETVAQQCYYAVHHDFAPQKCVMFPASVQNPPIK